MTYTVLNKTTERRSWWSRVRARSPYPEIAIVILALAIVPLFLVETTFYMNMILSTIVVVGLSLFMGYAGQAALGQIAFVAAGALTVAVVTVRWGLSPWVGLLAAPVVAGVFAALIGWPLLRLRGHYLAFGTLAVVYLVYLAQQSLPIFGSGRGILGIPPLLDLPIADTQLRNKVLMLIYVYLALLVLLIALIVTHRTVSSRFGRGIRALSGSESAAASAGVPVLASKNKVFVLAAVFAGAAGALTAFSNPVVTVESFPMSKSFEYVIMAVFGGLGTLWGGVVGAITIALLLQTLNLLAASPGMPAILGPTLQYAGYGVVLVLVLLFMPKGLVPTIGAAMERRRQRLSAGEG